MSWRKLAACQGRDLILFFPKTGGKGSGDKGRKICKECPVITECLEYAISMDCTGIWGGMDYEERQDYADRHVIRDRAA